MTKQPAAPGPDGTDTWEGPHVTETIESTTAAPEHRVGRPEEARWVDSTPC